LSFDEEHHRFVLWDDGETGEKPEDAPGVDHVGLLRRPVRPTSLSSTSALRHRASPPYASITTSRPHSTIGTPMVTKWRSPATICRRRPSVPRSWRRLKWLKQ
jgi:hypothetical protein